MLDIPFFKGDHKNFLIGPGSILVAHGVKEFVAKKDLREGVELYQRLATQILSL